MSDSLRYKEKKEACMLVCNAHLGFHTHYKVISDSYTVSGFSSNELCTSFRNSSDWASLTLYMQEYHCTLSYITIPFLSCFLGFRVSIYSSNLNTKVDHNNSSRTPNRISCPSMASSSNMYEVQKFDGNNIALWKEQMQDVLA